MKTELLEYEYYVWSEEPFPKDRCIGNNVKRMLVLADVNDIPEHLGFLKKILRAVSFDFETDLQFATMHEGETYRLLNTELIGSIDTLILFGIPPNRVGLNVHDAQRLLIFDSFQVLLAPSLSVLASDAAQKRALWGLLKHVFQV